VINRQTKMVTELKNVIVEENKLIREVLLKTLKRLIKQQKKYFLKY